MVAKVVEPLNMVVLVGTVERDPFIAELKEPGLSRVSFDVRCHGELHNDLVPVSRFGKADELAFIRAGSKVVVQGRVRRRWFSGHRVFVDVVADEIIPASGQMGLRRLFGSAMGALQVRAE